jgi:hypothetical protein
MTHASTMRAPFRRLSEYTGLYKLTRDRLEDVERIAGGGDDHTGDLGVPVELLDVFLALVDEQELRSVFAASGSDDQLTLWDLSVEQDEDEAPITALDANGKPLQVPSQLLFVHQGLVRARRGEYGWVGRVPFDGSDRGGVP